MSRESQDYKLFAEAAKEAGFDPDERKLSAMDPELLFEGTGKELREQLTPETLTSFFNALKGDKKADPKHILQAGNFLYNYRSNGKNGREKAVLNPQERRLTGLACRLVENAFYSGKLENLTDDQAAALAFTINVTAKLCEQEVEDSEKWFDKAKFKQLLPAVEDFKDKTLLSYLPAECRTDSLTGSLDRLDMKIRERIRENAELVEKTNWKTALSNIEKKLNSSIKTIGKSEGLFFAEPLELAAEWLKDRAGIIQFIKTNQTTLKECAENGKKMSEITPASLIEFLHLFKICEAERQARSQIGTIHRNAESLFKFLSEKIASDSDAKSIVVKDFSAVGRAFSQKNLPQAVKDLAPLFKKISETEEVLGPIREYLDNVRQISALISRHRYVKSSEQNFNNAKQSLLKKKDSPAVIPYFIKSCMIPGSIIRRHPDNQKNMIIRDLSILDEGSSYGPARAGEIATHSFLPGIGKFGSYADVHYVTQEIPLATWVMRYLQSKEQTK